jgi:hypothetical protein
MTTFFNIYFRSQNSPDCFSEPASEEIIRDVEIALGAQFPTGLREFYRQSNGFDGFIAEWPVILEPVERIFFKTEDTCRTFHPWAIYIGGNGGLEMFVLDRRSNPIQFGLLPGIGGDEDFIALGANFEQFIRKIYSGDVYG